MLKRYRAWRNRLTSETAVFGGTYFRVTRQRGKIAGIERWVASEHQTPGYEYTVWKAV